MVYKMKMNQKNETGITLIALIITVIILIILAGVLINLTLGNNGIFTRAKEAKEKYAEQQVREKVGVMLAEYSIDKNIDGKALTTYLDEQKEKGTIEDYTDNGDGTITIKIDGYDVIINANTLEILDVAKADGIIFTAQLETTGWTKSIDGTTVIGKITGIIKSNSESTTASIRKNGGEKLNIVLDSSGNYTYEITDNGTYVIEVHDSQIANIPSKTIVANIQIDSIKPEISDIRYEYNRNTREITLTASVEDPLDENNKASGIDYCTYSFKIQNDSTELNNEPYKNNKIQNIEPR